MSARPLLALLLAHAALAQVGNWTKLTLPGTHCLDGSPGVAYLRQPLLPSAAAPFILFFEGGGWCDGLANCYSRAQGDLGSSKNYPTLPPNALPPGVSYEGASLFSASPVGQQARIAYAKYCTGDSLTSSNSTPTYFNNTQLFFQGRAMLDALVQALLPLGMGAAPQVLVAGCSAGALTALSHIDYIATLLPPATLVAGLPDAMYAFNVSDFAGAPAPVGGMFAWGFSFWNSSSSVNQGCLAHYGLARGAACMFGGAVAPFVQAPLFVANSKHDGWQKITILGLNSTECPGSIAANGSISLCAPGYLAQSQFWVAYGQFVAAQLAALPPRHGGHLTNCPCHCQTGAGWADPSVGALATLGQAVAAWWPLVVAHGREPGWAAPRFIAQDGDECVGGCRSCL